MLLTHFLGTLRQGRQLVLQARKRLLPITAVTRGGRGSDGYSVRHRPLLSSIVWHCTSRGRNDQDTSRYYTGMFVPDTSYN